MSKHNSPDVHTLTLSRLPLRTDFLGFLTTFVDRSDDDSFVCTFLHSPVWLFCFICLVLGTEQRALHMRGKGSPLSPSYFFSNAGTITVTEPCILSFKLEMPLMARLIERHITKEKL